MESPTRRRRFGMLHISAVVAFGLICTSAPAASALGHPDQTSPNHASTTQPQDAESSLTGVADVPEPSDTDAQSEPSESEIDTTAEQSAAADEPSQPIAAADQQRALAQTQGFRAGNIISDANFYASRSMTEAQIDGMLREQVRSCASGSVCLKDFKQDTRSFSRDNYCAGYSSVRNESAARIIHKTAVSCGISPKVLIVMLQKEQGLVTATAPTAARYRIAMGMACPDTAPCDAQYFGFQNQVYNAARQLQVYRVSSYFNWYPVGQRSQVYFHPDLQRCGSSSVFIENDATASLYYYTPYQPNQAALATQFGVGDSCSAYGNRNFYNFYSQWFGSPHATP